MNVVVNGERREVPEGTTVRALVEMVAPKGAASAAEVNKELVPRRAQEGTVLKEGDVVEVVTLVGGG
ncbi:MAG TPA: sulfur carrier protein ThiS [Phycisphaerales bacterium]|nr:sulfur carrier protein ThiS [Phycisphaerales bacterium]